METLGVQSDLITKMSNICWILPYYDYAYESVKIIRGLCQRTRDLWLNQQDAIIRMLNKQIIHIGMKPIDDKTIEALKRGDKYKLFKLDIQINYEDKDRLQIFYRMLEELPEFEIYNIGVLYGDNKFIYKLGENPIFKNYQYLLKVLNMNDTGVHINNEPYEYLRNVIYPEKHNMS